MFINVIYIFLYIPYGLPYVALGVIKIYFPSHVQVLPIPGGQYHNCVHPLMGLHWPDHSWVFSSGFSLILFFGGFIMRFHGINLLRCAIELDGISALVEHRLGFLVFKWPLFSMILD